MSPADRLISNGAVAGRIAATAGNAIVPALDTGAEGSVAMRNPLKKLFGKSTKDVPTGKSPPIDAALDGFAELLVVWPDGTWNLPGYKNRKLMDEVSRSALLATAALEDYERDCAAEGRMLNPGWYARPDKVKPGWVPSETTFKKVFAKRDWDVGIMHYMVGDLTHRRKIKP